MSWLIVGTVPDDDFPLVFGQVRVENGLLRIGPHNINIARGTPALAATTSLAASELKIDGPYALLAGDAGRGGGSRKLYAHLIEIMADLKMTGFTFHYLQPDVDWHNKILWAIQDNLDSPCLVADAGFMYVAKMSGFAAEYDLFTPDIGEMSFLADETAPHPFYTRGFLLEDESKVEEYIARAYSEKNAARHLMVKGAKDYVVRDDVILSTISEPGVEAMEAIGGTGDSLTGIITGYLMAGYEIPRACHMGAVANRYLGLLANPTPAYSVAQLLPHLGMAMEKASELWISNENSL